MMICCVTTSARPLVSVALDSMDATTLPSGATRLVCTVISRAESEALVTVVCTRTVACVGETSGVLTKTPHGAMWTSSVTTSRTWR